MSIMEDSLVNEQYKIKIYDHIEKYDKRNDKIIDHYTLRLLLHAL